jgi:hypothetical protein
MNLLKELTSLSKSSTLIVVLTVSFLAQITKAQIIGPSVLEVKYSYTTTFEVPSNQDEDSNEDRAQFHASHLFGIFHSPTLVKRFHLTDGIGGIGGPRSQMKIKILAAKDNGSVVRITYSNSGKMILHKKVATALLEKGVFVLPLPVNPYEIYDKNCTDAHYTSFGDYWYFYDIFRKGCTYLSKEPKSVRVEIAIKPSEYKKMETKAPLMKLRGDNGNGSLFSIYVIHGFESDPKNKSDEGRSNFDEFNDYLAQTGFTLDHKKTKPTNSLFVFSKEVNLTNGKKIQVEIKHLLVTTGIESRSKLFAKFFKEAVETADVIAYGGHSGLGGNLDIPSLEEKAGTFNFNPNKKQIFFFDSCSSYSYYLEHFAVEKTKAKIDVITYGLSSYFHTSTGVLATFIEHLISAEAKDVLWSDILGDMEKTLEGDTYLLNVGGI